ncbi:MAG TPA: DUF6223 family protein [Thermoanaerobaculia bacterium]
MINYAFLAAVTPAFSLGRFGSVVAIVAGLIGVVLGALAVARSAGQRRRAIVTLVLGPIGLLIGGLVVATAGGGVGTGNGVGGAVLAMVVGLIAIILGGLALARSRRIA